MPTTPGRKIGISEIFKQRFSGKVVWQLFELLNIQGQLLRRTEIDFRRSDRRWNLGDLPAGAYLLRARGDGGVLLYSGIVFKM